MKITFNPAQHRKATEIPRHISHIVASIKFQLIQKRDKIFTLFPTPVLLLLCHIHQTFVFLYGNTQTEIVWLNLFFISSTVFHNESSRSIQTPVVYVYYVVHGLSRCLCRTLNDTIGLGDCTSQRNWVAYE